MNKKEILEIKKRFTKEQTTISRLCGCYVDGNRNKVYQWSEHFLNMEDEEFYKYLDLAKKCLSGKPGNNLLNLSFATEEEAAGGKQQILMALRESGLEDEHLLDAFYDHVIDTYDHSGNYLIVLFHDTYDIMKKTTDNRKLDESEEVFDYLLCAVCPVELSKPALGYREDENRIASRIRDWVVGAPESAFLFPSFNDRSTDIHAALMYTKNTKEPHKEFMEDVLGCAAVYTTEEKHMAFRSAVEESLGTEDETIEDILMDISQSVQEKADEYQTEHKEDTLSFDETELADTLKEENIPEEQAKDIAKSVVEMLGEQTVSAETLVDEKLLGKMGQRMSMKKLEDRLMAFKRLLEESAEEIENLYGSETELSKKIRKELE